MEKIAREVAYWVASLGFCAAWAAVSWSMISTRWYRVSPKFCTWAFLSTIQAWLTTAAGLPPSDWWTKHVWVPVEALAICATALVVIEAMPGRWGMSAAAGGLLAWPLAVAMAGPGSDWYQTFLEFREWVWLAAALALIHNSVWLFIRPEPRPPGAYRGRVLFGWYAAVAATVGPIAVSSGADWMTARVAFRLAATLILLRIYWLTPRFREATRLRWCSEASTEADPRRPAPDRRGR